ncbi:MAG: Glycosyl transferase group 1, partial [Candidatus Magasanikbacteria bacterium GW2011_GWC2_37_14]
MKISLIGPSYPFRGGISLNTTLLFRALKVKHEVEFYSFSRQYPKWLFPGKDDEEREFSLLKEEKAQRIIDSLNPYTWIKVFFKIRKNQSEVLI